MSSLRYRVLTGASAVVIGLAACVSVQGPAAPQPDAPQSAPPDPSPSAAGDPFQSAGACLTRVLFRSHDLPTIERLAKLSPTVVVATLTGYGDPLWDTVDGRPAAPDAIRVGDAAIFTPVNLDVSGEVKGPPEPAAHAVVWGGTIGCETFTTNQNPTLTEGSRYVAFLLPRTRKSVPTGDAWLVAAWQIGPTDQVETPIDGPRPLGQLMSEIREGKVAPTPTPGAEPTSGYP